MNGHDKIVSQKVELEQPIKVVSPASVQKIFSGEEGFQVVINKFHEQQRMINEQTEEYEKQRILAKRRAVEKAKHEAGFSK